MKIPFRSVLAAATLVLLSVQSVAGSDLRPFSSDGCTLFPDGTIKDRQKWCECCFQHDIAYWKGGTEDERKKADEALRDCVFSRTKDRTLAETMYRGVRAGGHPAFPNWYRWGYGWPYSRGWYKPLSDTEQQQVREKLDEYSLQHPAGYCEEKHPSTNTTATVADRPANWARPVKAAHLMNFYRIDDKVYRSAQPNEKGFRELEQLGIKNALSLRDYHTDEAEGTSLKLYRVKMEAGEITDEKVIEALRIIKKANGPILIHCWHGSDRTGLVSAMYRIVFQNWSREDAIDELMHGGYGYHSMYRNIPEYIRKVDVEKVRKDVQAP